MATAEKTLLIKMAEKLTAAQQELDELAVQLALGKAEARDKFEEVKKEFRLRVAEVKKAAGAREISEQLRAKIADLEGLLGAGSAEDKEAFEARRKKILEALKRVEDDLKDILSDLVDVNDFTHEAEKFKLKLEILRLKFVVGKFKVKDAFRTGMNDAKKEVSRIVTGAEAKVKKAKNTVTDFREEIQSAYKHMKKAIKNI